MENGSIKDFQITTSGVLKGTAARGAHARLHKNITPWGAWCPDVSGGSKTEKNYDQYIEIDLLKPTNVTGIATQGLQSSGGSEYAEDYKISYKRDGGGWNSYRQKDQTVKVNLIKIEFRLVLYVRIFKSLLCIHLSFNVSVPGSFCHKFFSGFKQLSRLCGSLKDT